MAITCPSPQMTPDIKALWREAFGDTDEFIESYIGSAFSPENCRCASENGEVVSVIHLLDCTSWGESFAYVYAAATKKDRRGRGVFRTLMDDTANYLKRRGYAGMILLPGDASLGKMYEKLGFSYFMGLTPRSVTASEGDLINIRRICADEYAEERQKYIPQGAVHMGRSMKDFLDCYAELYAGDTFVFARAGDRRSFIAAEFFGDHDKMPSVLNTLGYDRGQFYTSNGEMRAMYRRFSDGKAPSLLGVCFDI